MARQAGSQPIIHKSDRLPCLGKTRKEVAMNRISSFLLLLSLALLPTLALAQQGQGVVNRAYVHYAWANVTRVDPIYGTVQASDPYQHCAQQPVVHRESGSHTAGTLLGAVIGGVLGNTIGKGDGRKAATVAGAVAGGAVGHTVAGRGDRQAEDSVTRCQQVARVSQERRVVGYNVEYRYRGNVYMSRLDYDPGERLRVRVSVTPAD